jgi:aminomethyltransferase
MTTTTDHPLIGISPRIRKSPFFDAIRRWGCRAYTTYNHMLTPLYFESTEADFARLSRDVTLWDTAGQRQVEITGPDAAQFAQYLVSRDISKCAVGQCKYVVLTTPAGGIVNDPVLLKLGAGHFWLSLADNDVLLWAMGVAQGAGMDVALSEPDVSPLQVQGPKSRALMGDLFGDWTDAPAATSCGSGSWRPAGPTISPPPRPMRSAGSRPDCCPTAPT